MSDVNGNQKIEAPAKARPLSALTRSLGGDALGGLGAPGVGPEAVPVAPDEPSPPSSGAGGDGSGQGSSPPDAATGDSPEAEAFRKYADCLDKARPEDTAELQKCADVLHP